MSHRVCLCHGGFFYILCSLSANMLTCQTPPQDSLSQLNVQLRIDGVSIKAPVNYSYNEDPLIHNVQPTRSFIRCVSYVTHNTASETSAASDCDFQKAVHYNEFSQRKARVVEKILP